jgi:hypothetical protein
MFVPSFFLKEELEVAVPRALSARKKFEAIAASDLNLF